MIKIHKQAIGQKRVNSKSKTDRNLKVFSAVILAAFIYGFYPSGVSASGISVQKIIELTNADRMEKGLSKLTENEKLKKAAENKAEDMIRNNYFSHNSPGGVTPWHWMEQEKYDYDFAGENLAMDFTTSEKMNEAWLASPTHRANILSEKYQDIGIAVKEGAINGHKTLDVVQMFGSGDKSKNDMRQEEKKSDQIKNDKETFFPPLPLEDGSPARTSNLVSAQPVITSPEPNETFSETTLEVIGRAAPKEKVSVSNDSQEIGQAISDENGWFHFEIDALTEGKHNLKVQNAISSGRRKSAENVLDNEVSILVDRFKPQVNYRLFANGNKFSEYILEASSDKPNCVFEIGGKTVSAGAGGTAIFPVFGGNLSTILKVKDRAGNKITKQIVLANYYQGNGQHNIVEEMAQMLFSEKVFAADSGRGAIENNLGFAITDFNH